MYGEGSEGVGYLEEWHSIERGHEEDFWVLRVLCFWI